MIFTGRGMVGRPALSILHQRRWPRAVLRIALRGPGTRPRCRLDRFGKPRRECNLRSLGGVISGAGWHRPSVWREARRDRPY